MIRAVRIHHLNCGTLRPIGGRLVNGERLPALPARIVCHCLLVETGDRLVLVDTGFGTGDIARLRPVPPALRDGHRLWQQVLANLLLRAKLDVGTTAARQVTELGHSPGDVTDIVMTHLDWDHAGGIADFPRARVHVDRAEHDFATSGARTSNSVVQRRRYWSHQWSHGPDWVTYGPAGGEEWFGFEGVRELDGLPELAFVPLPGHSPGQCGVAIRTGGDGSGSDWLLHAADAYFDHRELDPDEPRTTPGLATFQKVFEHDAGARRDSRARLRELNERHAGEVELFCTHDPVELDRYAGAAA
jgi:glyoxylase-like metal-dependent hydrolase (beta-lactamase superfamily II)